MPVIAKKLKAAHTALNPFRFGHRGAKDYAGLLQHYRTRFKMPQSFVVRLTGFSPRSVAKWSEGILPSPKQEKALVGQWLKSPNPAFDGLTPLQIVERGEIDRLGRMLFDLESGQPG
jgi:hypothetical protein